MRLHITALLALPAALVAAVPAHLEQQQTFAASSRSRWRTLSDRLIDSLWGWPQEHRRVVNAERQVPPHTLARYGEDVVVRFNISTAEEAQSLAEAADTLLLDVWEFAQDWVDIRLSKDIVGPLLGLLPQSLQHSHTPLLRERDLAQAIYDTYPTPRGQHAPQTTTPPSPLRHRPFSPALQPGNGEQNIFFSDYQPLSVIEPWMRLLASLFTTHVRKVNIGLSAEGRNIPGLRVGVHPTNSEDPNPPKRKTILMLGGQHAREWVSTSTVNYVAYSLITGYGKNQATTALLETFDFVFVPTLNPDGYTYTWDTDRLWRKNRQRTTFRFCQGIDVDRAFGFQWDGHVSTAGNPCSESFAGEEAFEAVEAKALADWARNETENNNVDFVGFLDLHSYSQQILYPYSYTCEDTPPGLENLEELAMGLGKAIRVSHGHNYEVMPACEGNVVTTTTNDKKDDSGKHRLWPRMEASGGSALDWFYHELRVRFAYQIKLRDRGTYGFLLPKENIVPTGKEILDAVLYFGGFVGEVFEAEAQAAAAAAGGKSAAQEEEDDGGEGAREEALIDELQPLAGVSAEVPLGEENVEGQEEDSDGYLRVEDVQWELRRRRRR